MAVSLCDKLKMKQFKTLASSGFEILNIIFSNNVGAFSVNIQILQYSNMFFENDIIYLNGP